MSRDDKGRPEAGSGGHVKAGQTDKRSVRPLQRDETLRHCWAQPFLVLGTRGRLRVVLLVTRCAFGCGRSHLHSGPVDFNAGMRNAGCCNGRYMVHALAADVAA